ncbi:MarR family transcriptional regulator [Tritonibacter mobilis]|nr:MarR family transcriptional regulator [Tritonibacter mobilis]
MSMNAKALESQLEKVRELESRLTFRLSVLSKRLDQDAAALLKDTPLGLTSYRILNVVNTFEIISISDLSRFCSLDRAQVSRTAVEMEKLGIVSFEADTRSKRKKLVAITGKGLDMLASVRPAFEARRKQIEAGLGEEALAGLWHGLEQLGIILDE